MFSFDITLIVQMMHFFFAWWFIDHFLFKKLVDEVNQEHSFTTGLQKKLEEEVRQIADLAYQKETELKRFRDLYKDQIPFPIIKYTESEVIQFQSPIEISVEERSILVNEISQQFVRQIFHD